MSAAGAPDLDITVEAPGPGAGPGDSRPGRAESDKNCFGFRCGRPGQSFNSFPIPVAAAAAQALSRRPSGPSAQERGPAGGTGLQGFDPAR
jgi:hypothetical protein